MNLLLYSGIVYLLGVGFVLFIRPDSMFREDGSWKEFGVGRDPLEYTWMPFWLFVIMWALLSYMIVLFLAGANLLPGISAIEEKEVSLTPRQHKKAIEGVDMTQPGYYILNASNASPGSPPKYIYLGPSAPNLVYNSQDK